MLHASVCTMYSFHVLVLETLYFGLFVYYYFVISQSSWSCICIWLMAMYITLSQFSILLNSCHDCRVEYETILVLSHRLEMYEVITQHPLRQKKKKFLLSIFFVYSFKLEIGNSTILIFYNHLILTARRLKPSKLNVC